MINKFKDMLVNLKVDLKTISNTQFEDLCTSSPQFKYLLISYKNYLNKAYFDYKLYFEPWSQGYSRAIKLRKIEKAHTPHFTRYAAHKFKRLDPSVWRKPKGLHNKKRRKVACKGAYPTIGYSVPKLVRYANNKGYFETLCYNELQLINAPVNTMIRFSSKIGLKKQVYLEYIANSNKRYVINPINWKYII